MLNIGWFSAGRDEAARQLLQTVQDRIQNWQIDGRISFVFGNRQAGETEDSNLFSALVGTYNVPLICSSHNKFKTVRTEEASRTEYDRGASDKIASFACNLCVLAGYMPIVSEELCQKRNMINLHPAPPDTPTGSWQEVIWALMQNKADTAGAMMHLATPELDRHPVVSCCLFSVKGEAFAEYRQKDDKNTLFRLIRHHELAREFALIPLTPQLLSRGEISIKNGRVTDARDSAISGYNLTQRLDEQVKKTLG